MNRTLKIALAQQDFLVGDLPGNRQRILYLANEARDQMQADIVVFPELCLTGYPPEDLLLRGGFIRDCEKEVNTILAELQGITAVIGCPVEHKGRLFNSAVAFRDGVLFGRYDKQNLPNYSVFDEKRYFSPGRKAFVIDTPSGRLGVTICEDIWVDGPVEQAVSSGAQIILNLNASPYHMDKVDERIETVSRQAQKHSVPVVYVNLVGGQDELVFDGGSFVIDRYGEKAMQAPVFTESLTAIEFRSDNDSMVPCTGRVTPELDRLESIYTAIVTGVRDYVQKNGFKGAVIGLSGGIDSALTLAIASDALGAGNVEAVLMPSRYTHDMSIEDAVSQADALGVHHKIIPIEPMFQSFLDALEDSFSGMPVDTTEENIQARCRGVLLMAISNKQDRIVLTTGNKSEMAVGYATLYGDMAGGYAVIKDVPKMLVYELANWRNEQSQVIPQRVIDRPPSAELAPDQKDEDSLPPYEILDAILECYVEQDLGLDEIADQGFDRETVQRVIRMVDLNEYKRKQAAPGVRITRRAFGRDRRYPITSGYRHDPE
ncbi:MAG TPA: NAD+ synthase [Gammaproteobacteria bacterium]|nr:NAD+ synthase [Gammaproteobacteria bacterium]